MRYLLLAPILVLCTGLANAAQAPAKTPPPTGKVTPWEAMKIANRKLSGRALSANFTFEDGHWQYEVFIVKDSTLHEVEVDATTGKLLDSEVGSPAQEAAEMAKSLNRALGKTRKVSPKRSSARK